MFLNVAASMAPSSGALFISGTLTVRAKDDGVKSRLDAITIPAATDANAIRNP
jgi:hypothetical protein